MSPTPPFIHLFIHAFAPCTHTHTPTVYTLANRLFLPESEVKETEARLEGERKANEAAVAMYKARRVRGSHYGSG